MKRVLITLMLLLTIADVTYIANYKEPQEIKQQEKLRYGKPKKKKKLPKTKRVLVKEYIGKFTLTAYCPCKKCNGNSHQITASGEKLKAGKSIAVDAKIIPFYTDIYIDGVGKFVAHDTGSAIKGNRIDICFPNHKAALKFGRKKNVKVYSYKYEDRVYLSEVMNEEEVGINKESSEIHSKKENEVSCESVRYGK